MGKERKEETKLNAMADLGSELNLLRQLSYFNKDMESSNEQQRIESHLMDLFFFESGLLSISAIPQQD